MGKEMGRERVRHGHCFFVRGHTTKSKNSPKCDNHNRNADHSGMLVSLFFDCDRYDKPPHVQALLLLLLYLYDQKRYFLSMPEPDVIPLRHVRRHWDLVSVFDLLL